MRVALFGAKPYDRRFFEAALKNEPELAVEYFEERLNVHTVPLADGYEAVCLFVNDHATAPILDRLVQGGCKFIALRSAGFNNVDMPHADAIGLTVARVPAYSPHAVAEHAMALLLSVLRRTYRAYNRTRDGNFELEGLLGRCLYGATIGVIGTGKIGLVFAQIARGFGSTLLAHDPYPNPELERLGGRYVDLPTLLRESDVISLHCPLTPESHYLIDEAAVDSMKRGVILVNTSRGGLVDTRAIIEGLKSGQIGGLALDVYEQEESLFFENLSDTIIQDDVFQRLLTFPNVLVTGHQAFFTEEALNAIAETTVANLAAFARGEPLVNRVSSSQTRPRT
jgi:D-lactate dehydrogenase